jgi:DTW domain-containing protein YfiP
VKDLDVSKIKRMVCVDSQWHRTKKMMSDPRLQKLRCVKIESYKTRFWRYQKEGDTCLATIEAIYYFAKEFEEARSGNYQGQFDDLLWYYSHMYRLIQKTYKTNPDKRFNKINNYIKY